MDTSGDTAKQGRRYRELINYIQNVTKGTIHEHSPHTQDLLRFLNSEIDLVEKARFDGKKVELTYKDGNFHITHFKL
jgi:hypothetical protein